MATRQRECSVRKWVERRDANPPAGTDPPATPPQSVPPGDPTCTKRDSSTTRNKPTGDQPSSWRRPQELRPVGDERTQSKELAIGPPQRGIAAVMRRVALNCEPRDPASSTAKISRLRQIGCLVRRDLAVIAIAHLQFRLNAILAFWAAYIVTRPLGASIGACCRNHAKSRQTPTRAPGKASGSAPASSSSPPSWPSSSS